MFARLQSFGFIVALCLVIAALNWIATDHEPSPDAWDTLVNGSTSSATCPSCNEDLWLEYIGEG